LPQLEYFQNGVLLTGASGFLGGHLARALRGATSSRTAEADVRNKSALQELAAVWPADVVLHLASKGTVIAPLDAIPEMLDVAVDGLVHLLACFAPRMLVLPSSCAVYGDTGLSPVLPSAPTSPLSVYGLSKVISELVLCQWAATTGNTGIVLRLGNLIGPSGRGLISYLVNHGLRYPEGSPPAEMRCEGQLVRDYVPIAYVVRVFQALLRENWQPGQTYLFNVGTGKPRTNGQVAVAVQHALSERGVVLNVHYSQQPEKGEARLAVMNTRETDERLALTPPTDGEIDDAIRDAVLFHLESAKLARAVPAAT